MTIKSEKVRKDRMKKYNEFLSWLYNELKDGPKSLGISKVLKTNNLNSWFVKTLKTNNILNTYGSGSNVVYEWIHPTEPDMELTQNLIDNFYYMLNKAQNENKSRRNPAKSFSVKESSKEIKKTFKAKDVPNPVLQSDNQTIIELAKKFASLNEHDFALELLSKIERE
jgi:hypothetical protein